MLYLMLLVVGLEKENGEGEGRRQPTPVFLPGESQGRGSLVGSHRVGHN